MKHLNILLVAILFIVGVSVTNAQDQNNPWSIEVGVNAVDFFPIAQSDFGKYSTVETLNGTDYTTKGGLFEKYLNVGDHWNMIPTISAIKVGRYVGSGFTFVAVGTVNKIQKVGDYSVNDLAYIGVDGEIKYSFRELLNDCWFAPYLGVGGGYTWIENIGFGTANALAGVDLWVSKRLALTFQSTYKQAFEDNYGATHFQHTAGMKFEFGGKDTDGDGIYDYEDECPLIPGIPEFNGCPDTDGDGIEDRYDECPYTPGLPEFNGCPDTDGDGIPDILDACPLIPGLPEFDGCPDTDGDGLPDNLDECPLVPGPIANNGCPWADGDGDGVWDKDDKCPDLSGTVANDGCPEVTESVKTALNTNAKTVLFNVDKATILEESSEVLDNIVDIMNDYPTANFLIEGHCDSYGSVELNNKLSEDRAKSVENYLQSKGIADERLTSKGFGKSNPLYTNKTREGRAKNRRVEISLNKN
ncbi:MAG: OmpA family protein [Flavobacteriaceae bacterium]|jgi:OOP family OmpA-OmpF porin|nr:OmpA family protein [Flavobacteriaceae bacterium]